MFALLTMLAAGENLVLASGPLGVTGPGATTPGQPYRWNLNPIPYKTDLGLLGNQTNAAADTMVSDAFTVWNSVPTANLSFTNAGHLGFDVTAANILAFQNAIQDCNDPTQPTNAIIYDLDGSIVAALGMDNNSVMGFAGPSCADPVAGVYARGRALLNGRFIDGSSPPPGTVSHKTVSLDTFKAVFIHEFGHLLGMDHTQINLNCLTNSPCPATDLQGVPTMFPVLVTLGQATLHPDDQAFFSVLYPAGNFASTTGRIRGHILFSDGATPAQGYNVIARQVADPRRIAVSSVSGFRYTAGAGNPLAPANGTELPDGSRDQTLIGYYDIRGLPAGDYTIEVEAINNSGQFPFVGGSGLVPMGQLGFQFKLPGSCIGLEYLNDPETATDDCSTHTTLAGISGGSDVNVHTDIILNGTPPRYDAWEDGP